MSIRTARSEGFIGRGAVIYGGPLLFTLIYLFTKDYTTFNKIEAFFYTTFLMAVVPLTLGLSLDWCLHYAVGRKSKGKAFSKRSGGSSGSVSGGQFNGHPDGSGRGNGSGNGHGRGGHGGHGFEGGAVPLAPAEPTGLRTGSGGGNVPDIAAGTAGGYSVSSASGTPQQSFYAPEAVRASEHAWQQQLQQQHTQQTQQMQVAQQQQHQMSYSGQQQHPYGHQQQQQALYQQPGPGQVHSGQSNFGNTVAPFVGQPQHPYQQQPTYVPPVQPAVVPAGSASPNYASGSVQQRGGFSYPAASPSNSYLPPIDYSASGVKDL